MKVLHIIDSGGLYGAETMLLHLVEEQKKLGLQPTIASIGAYGIKGKPLEIEGARRGITVQCFRMHPGPNFAGAYGIIRFARERRMDIIHTHGYKGDILFGVIPKNILKLPRVTTLHGWTNTKRFNRMWFYQMLDAVSLRFMDAVILVNDRMQQHPLIRGRRSLNLHIIPNGIPHEPKSKLVLENEIVKFCSKGPVIGTVGRLSHEKGHTILLDAIKMLEFEFPNLRLLIVGEGDLQTTLERKAAAIGLGARVLFSGYKARAWVYLPLLDLFVLPSLTEGLPITLLEAMRANCPIVATAVGGIPAALESGSAGIIVPPGNAAGLAKGIREILDHPVEAEKRSRKALDIFKHRFSSRQMAERYLGIYRAVCARGYPCQI